MLIRILRYYPLTLAWYIFVYTVCLLPVPETPLNHVIGIDKLVHLALWFIASCIIWWEYGRAPGYLRPRRAWWITCLLPVLSSGSIELLQSYATTCRSGDWYDFLFNSAGVMLALIIHPQSSKR